MPAQLVDTIAGLKHGGAFKCLRNLLRHKLVHHDGQKYDGYRLTPLGYDFLAIRALTARGAIAGVGRQIGVGKESDVFEVMDDEGNVMALKLHRLGRTSFRAVKSKRDYMKRGNHFSWLYLSRLAALKEFAFMKALGEAGLPVPRAIEVNRHAVLMSMINASPMVQVRELENPRKVYEECMEVLVRLAALGLVHCDYNEFNLLISEDQELTLIDFPQMVSISHPNAQELFERDVEGVVKFFERKLGYLPDGDPALDLVRPKFEDALAQATQAGVNNGGKNLDETLRASGFKKEHESALEKFIRRNAGGSEGESDDEEESEEEKEESEEDDTSSETGEEESEEEEEEEEGSAVSNEVVPLAKVVESGTAEKDQEEERIASPREESEEESGFIGDLEEETREKLRLEGETVIARAAEERRRAAKRAAMAKVSRNASKSKNKGKKKSDAGGLGGGGGVWG